MDQNQDQNDNLFNFDKKPDEASSDEPTILSGSGARVYETPPAQPEPPAEPFPAYTPPPPAYTPPGPSIPPPAKKNRTWLIVIIVLVLLCCCCLALALSGYYIWGDPLMESLGIY